MKLTRLSLLLFALVMSVLTVPEAFGARDGVRGKGVGRVSKAKHSITHNKSSDYCDGFIYSITCSNGLGACCTGTRADCLDFCEWYCNESCSG